MSKKSLIKNLPYQKNIKEAKIPFKEAVGTAVTFNLIFLLISGLFILRLPPQIPLFYGLPEGEGQLAPNWGILIPSISSFSVMIVNSIIANFVKDEYLKKALILAGFAAIFFALTTTLKIFFLVGSIF